MLYAVVVLALFAAYSLTSAASRASDVSHASGCLGEVAWRQLVSPEDPGSARGTAAWGHMTTMAATWIPQGRLYAGGGRALYQSDDCGATWKTVLEYAPPARAALLITAVAGDPTGRIYVMSAGQQVKSLQVSLDDGATWRMLNDAGRSIPVPQGGLVMSPTGRLYVRTAPLQGVVNADGFGFSDDAGESWSISRGNPGPASFAADAMDPGTIYAVGRLRYQSSPPQPTPGIPVERLSQSPPYELVRSVDSGRTFQPWSAVEELPGAIAVSVDGSRFWFASYGQHLWQSRDKGQTWQILDDMPFQDPKQLTVSPHDPRILYAVSGDGHIWVYREPDPTP
jgi:photosystem II stability/assembly factor-like uncharacterized protein